MTRRLTSLSSENGLAHEHLNYLKKKILECGPPIKDFEALQRYEVLIEGMEYSLTKGPYSKIIQKDGNIKKAINSIIKKYRDGEWNNPGGNWGTC